MSCTAEKPNAGPLLEKKWRTFFEDRNGERVVSSGKTLAVSRNLRMTYEPLCEFLVGQLMYSNACARVIATYSSRRSSLVSSALE
jgi:hypothetical protein